MKEYEVRIDLNSLYVILTAKNKDEAIKQAFEIAMQESNYELLKAAEYSIEGESE